MSDSWYSGEYLAGRIIITILFVFLAFWILLLCYADLRLDFYKCYDCFYKTATVIPLEEAKETIEPINSYAKDIPLNSNVIIL